MSVHQNNPERGRPAPIEWHKLIVLGAGVLIVGGVMGFQALRAGWEEDRVTAQAAADQRARAVADEAARREEQAVTRREEERLRLEKEKVEWEAANLLRRVNEAKALASGYVSRWPIPTGPSSPREVAKRASGPPVVRGKILVLNENGSAAWHVSQFLPPQFVPASPDEVGTVVVILEEMKWTKHYTIGGSGAGVPIPLSGLEQTLVFYDRQFKATRGTFTYDAPPPPESLSVGPDLPAPPERQVVPGEDIAPYLAALATRPTSQP